MLEGQRTSSIDESPLLQRAEAEPCHVPDPSPTPRMADAALILRACVAGSDLAWFSCFCGLLADPTRLRILQLLERSGELNVQALCDALTTPQPTISHHLGLLRRGGVVHARREGKRIFYALDGHFAPAPLRIAT